MMRCMIRFVTHFLFSDRFDEQYRCYPVSFCDKDHLEDGDKSRFFVHTHHVVDGPPHSSFVAPFGFGYLGSVAH